MSTTSARQPINTSAPYVTSVAVCRCRWMTLRPRRPLWCLGDLTIVTVLSGTSQFNLNKLQGVQNAVAHTVMTTSNREHITPVLAELHWLPVAVCIDFKIAVITFNLLTTELPLVSGIHSLIQSLIIWKFMHWFLNPDLKHSSTEGPISNHSMTLIASVIRLIGRHTACF